MRKEMMKNLGNRIKLWRNFGKRIWRGKTFFLKIKYLIMVICGDFLGVVYL
jgi:hypothetical protein